MTNAEARRLALGDAVAILGVIAYSGSRGVAPAYEANKFIAQKDKEKIRREFDRIIMSLRKREIRAEKEVERQYRRDTN